MLNGIEVGSAVRYIGRTKRDLPHGYEARVMAFGRTTAGPATGAPMIPDKAGQVRLRARKDWEVIRSTVSVPKPPVVSDNRDARIAELEAFKNMALSRHPDLAVSDEFLTARRILAHRIPDKKDAFMRGDFDGKPVFLAVVDALNTN